LGQALYPGGIAPMNIPAWSLFYEVAANILYAPLSRATDKSIVAVIAIAWGALAYLTIRHNSVNFGFYRHEIPAGFARVIFSFFVGVILKHVSVRHGRNIPPIAGWILGSAVFLTFLPNEFFSGSAIYELLCITAIYPLVVVLGAASADGRIATITMMVLGEISYPIYILHMPLLHWLSAWLGAFQANPATKCAISVVTAAIAAYIVVRFIDEPVRKWLTQNIFPKQRPPDRFKAQ
jgi:peptidoglycan/LPS O-acetylase OafA/YrhL